MKYGDSWKRVEINARLKEKLGGQLKDYYKWKLKTYETGCAHVFFCKADSCEELEKNWQNIVDHIAVCIQGEVSDLLERSNFYIWFYVKGKVERNLVKEIEDDTYSSRKFVVQVKEEADIGIDEMLNNAEKKIFTFNFSVPESDTPMITRVEFFNFRVYKGKRVFDFVKNGVPARLVVLFAPNGMGKTSFFDGIEWGFSGSVSRFMDIADKSISKIPVLKNMEADKEPAYVKIYDQEGHWIERRVSDLNGRTHKDYGAGTLKYSQGNPLGEYLFCDKTDIWGNLILPHHKIDGFIAGMKPKALYKEWGGLWDTDGSKRKQFEESYKRRKEADKRWEEAKGAYDKLLKEYRHLEASRDFVERLEQNIDAYHKIAESTKIEKLNFSKITASEYVRWSNCVDIQFETYEKELEFVKKKCEYLDNEVGNDIQKYYLLDSKIKKNEQEQKKVREFILQCNDKSILLKQKETFMKELEASDQLIKEARFLQKQGKEWYQDALQYFDSDHRIAELEEMVSEMEKRISLLHSERNRLIVQLKEKGDSLTEEKEYMIVCEHAKEMNEITIKSDQLETKKEEIRKKLEELENKILKLSLRQEELEKEEISSFENIKETYKEHTVFQKDGELENRLVELYNLIGRYRELEEKRLFISQQILAEEQAEERVKILLAESRKLIEDQEISYCPVCNTSFNNTRQLIQSTYRVLSKEGNKRTEEKTELEKEMYVIRFCAEQTINEYNIDLFMVINGIKKHREELQKDIREKNKELEEMESEWNTLTKRFAELKREDQEKDIFVVYTKEGISNWRKLWKTKLNKEISELKSALQKVIGQIMDYLERSQELKKKCNSLKSLIIRMESQSPECYKMMRDTEILIKSKEYSELDEWVQKQISDYESLEKKIAESEEKLEGLQDIAISLKEEYEERDKMIQQQLECIKKEFISIKKRIEEGFAIEISSEINETYFCALVKEKKKILFAQKEHIASCMESLKNLKYNREAENYFLRWKELTEQLKKAEESDKAEKEKLRQAEENYDLQKQKIEKGMENFLQRYRMGEIYEKLEPHEELKHLVVEFSFNEKDQPELLFSVVGNEGKTYPPAWFLSTAQLNVVAFAIFLGRALQKEDVPLKSIFIDDPIGHFDEMNIVGFVDLLRNILENTDRQLIISTHEERVFGLMKRKMPEESYPTCYLDFRELME